MKPLRLCLHVARPNPSLRLPIIRTPRHFAQNNVAFTRLRLSRHYSSSSLAAQKPSNPRIVEELKQRIGRCIQFGISKEQVDRLAGPVLRQLARDWRELLAGSEGFLTGSDRRGLWRHQVVWGDMVGLCCSVREERVEESEDERFWNEKAPWSTIAMDLCVVNREADWDPLPFTC